jgi:hypothetical protein
MWARQWSWLWTTGKGRPNRPPLTSTGCSGAGREFQVPWCPHHQQTIMVQTHLDSREEGTTKTFPPQETEKIWHGSPDPLEGLQLHHREHVASPPGMTTARHLTVMRYRG